LNPNLVPMGTVTLIPSLIFQRFTHLPLQAEQALISKKEVGNNQSEVTVAYQELGRKVSIRYQQLFPYEIVGFTESYTNAKGQVEMTTATRTHLRMMAYWNQNEKLFEPLRNELGL